MLKGWSRESATTVHGIEHSRRWSESETAAKERIQQGKRGYEWVGDVLTSANLVLSLYSMLFLSCLSLAEVANDSTLPPRMGFTVRGTLTE